MLSRFVGVLLDAFDDAEVAGYAAIERLKGFFIFRRFVGGDGGVQGVKLDKRGALDFAGLKGLGRFAATEKSAAGSHNRGTGDFRIRGQFLFVIDCLIGTDPLDFWHDCLPGCAGSSISFWRRAIVGWEARITGRY